MRDPKDMPPVPRDHDRASFSELMPIRSSKINLRRSPLLIFVLLTAVVVVLCFGLLAQILDGADIEAKQSAFTVFAFLVTAYLLAVVLLVVYLYSKSDKPLWAYGLNFLFVCVLLITPLGLPYFIVFRDILPGGEGWINSTSMVPFFIGMFFGAGLMEELMKVTLVLFGALLTFRAAQLKPKLPAVLFDALRIRGPLDGLVMGIFGGAGFILIETWMQYVPNMVGDVFRMTQGNDLGAFGAGLMLLFPRVVGGMVGHMAWAGITGYFIGLAILRPSRWHVLFLIGWIGTSLLHAMWNTQGFVPLFAWFSALASGVMVIACLLKARQLEAGVGRTVDTYGSVVVDRPPARPLAPSPQPQAAARPSAPTPTAPTASAAPPPLVPAAGAAPALALSLPGTSVPLVAEARIDLGAQPSLGGRGRGVLGEVTRHPTRADVLGLKNLGEGPWNVRLRDGTQQVVEPQRNLRLAAGVQIDFGDGLQAVVVQA